MKAQVGVAALTTAVLAAACGGHAQAHATAAAPTIPAYSPSAVPSATAAASVAASSTPSVSPSPTGPVGCRVADLAVHAAMAQAGLGHVGQLVVFTNTSATPCTLYGYMGLRLVDASRHDMATQVIRGQGYLYRDPGPHLVTLAPGGTASAAMEWDHIPGPGDPQSGCPTSTYLEITPPNDVNYLFVRDAVDACGGGQIHVTAVQAGSAGPAT